MATIDSLKEGQKVHKLTFVGEIEKRGIRTYIKVKCDCGVIKFVEYQNWRMGKTKTCGCEMYPKTNDTKHPLYPIWQSMKTRCNNPNDPRYPLYGGNGVRVCEEWNNNFHAYRDWALSNGWKPGTQIDKDKKAQEAGVEAKMYSPEWCSILTAAQNSRLTENTKLTIEQVLEIRKAKGSAAKIAKPYGISREHVRNIRLGKKWKDI